MKKKITIGLDIGIASVGWAIINSEDPSEIIDFGVRLFDEVNGNSQGKYSTCEQRRQNRGLRRIKRRKQQRKKDLIKLLAKYKEFEKSKEEIEQIIKEPKKEKFSILNLKEKGMHEQLNPSEQIVTLYNYFQHRGWLYRTSKEKTSDKMPYEIYKENLEKYGKFIGVGSNVDISNKDFIKEIKKWFENQKNITEEFKNEYLTLFQRHRNFNEGPGSKKSPTEYGLWRLKNGQVKKIGNNLWDIKINKCQIYKNEICGLKESPIMEFSNLLNDLNTLKARFRNKDYGNLGKDFKEFLFGEISKIIEKKKDLSKKFLKDKLEEWNGSEIESNSIQGIDWEDKSKWLSNFLKITNFIIEIELIKKDDLEITNLGFIVGINKIFNAISKSEDIDEKIKNVRKTIKNLTLKNLFFKGKIFDENKFLLLVEKNLIDSIGKTNFNKRSNYSYKAKLEYIRDAIVSDNLTFNNFVKNKEVKILNGNDKENSNLKGKYFPKDYFEKMPFSLVAKRSINQTINIFNNIKKKYGKFYEIDGIAIEMAKEKNSGERKKYLEKINKENKNLKKAFEEATKKRGLNWNIEDKFSDSMKMKFALWQEQNGKDIYNDGEVIPFEDLDGSWYQLDHIIPDKYRMSSGRQNLVLTKSGTNNEKSGRTPYQWMSQEKFSRLQKSIYETYKKIEKKDEKENKRINKKIELLLSKENPLDMMENFVERNLIDTRISTKMIKEGFEIFSKVNNLKTKIFTINGSFTSYTRKLLKIPKDRDLDIHHAIDALIIAFNCLNKNVINNINIFNNPWNEENKNKYVGIDIESIKNIPFWEKFKENLKKINSGEIPTKFSSLRIKKENTKLFNESSYGFQKSKNQLVEYINLLDNNLDKKFFDCSSLAINKDKKIFEKLVSILNLKYSEFLKDEVISKGLESEEKKENEEESLNDNKNLDQSEKSKNPKKVENNFKKYVDFLNSNFEEEMRKCGEAVPIFNDLDYSDENFLGKIKKEDFKNATKIKKLKRIIKENKYFPANKEENRFVETKYAICCRIYKQNGKFIPINISFEFLNSSKDNKTLEINEEKINKSEKLETVNNKNVFFEIWNGTTIVIQEQKIKDFLEDSGRFKEYFQRLNELNLLKNKVFKFIGSYNNSMRGIEIKPIGKATKIEKIPQIIISLDKINKYFYICDVDPLGNIHNRRTLDDIFKKLEKM